MAPGLLRHLGESGLRHSRQSLVAPRPAWGQSSGRAGGRIQDFGLRAEPEAPRPLLQLAALGPVLLKKQEGICVFLSFQTRVLNLHPLGFAIFTHPEPSGLHGDASNSRFQAAMTSPVPFLPPRPPAAATGPPPATPPPPARLSPGAVGPATSPCLLPTSQALPWGSQALAPCHASACGSCCNPWWPRRQALHFAPAALLVSHAGPSGWQEHGETLWPGLIHISCHTAPLPRAASPIPSAVCGSQAPHSGPSLTAGLGAMVPPPGRGVL